MGGNAWIRTLVRAFGLVVAVLALSTPAAGAPALDYFALGDSVASGHGLLDNGGTCRRSPAAYPRMVLSKLRERHERVRFRISPAPEPSRPDRRTAYCPSGAR